MAEKVRRPRIPPELAARIDAERGLVPFEAWVRRALEQALGEPVEVRRERDPVGDDGQGQSQSARAVARSGLEIDAPPPAPARASSVNVAVTDEGELVRAEQKPSPAVVAAREALDAPSPLFAEAEKLRLAGVRPAREFVKPFRPSPKS